MTQEDLLVRFVTDDQVEVSLLMKEVSEEWTDEQICSRALYVLLKKGYPAKLKDADCQIEVY